MSEQCSYEHQHTPHTWGGRPMRYCDGNAVTGNDRVADDKLRTNDISGLSIPARPGQGAKL